MAVKKLEDNTRALFELGFTGRDNDEIPGEIEITDTVEQLVEAAIYAGEELLLYHRPLARSLAAYGFLHQNDLLSHWDRYQKSGRVAREVHQLVKDIHDLLGGYRELVAAWDTFVVGELELPAVLESDFRLARNLFSVGFDDVALLIAGLGVEGVLRKIASVRKISIEIKGKVTPASEAELYDLIEAMYQVRWRTKASRLISSDTRALLHYLRTLRNSGAHAPRGAKQMTSPREMVAVAAQTANLLWLEVSTTRSRLTPTTIQKTW